MRKVSGSGIYEASGKALSTIFFVGVDIGNVHVVAALQYGTFRSAPAVTEEAVGVVPGRSVGGAGDGYGRPGEYRC